MARRPSKKAAAKKTSVSVNFKGVQSRQLLPEDDYRLKLVEAESGESSSGNDQITWVFAVNDGSKFDGQKLWFHTPLTENSLWKLHALLTAMGIEVPDDELDLDLEEMVEAEHEIMGVVQHETYDGTKRSKMMDFYAVEEGSEAPEKGKAGAKGGKKAKGLTKDAVEALDRDELVELIEEHDLDIDADDKGLKKDAKLLAAVLEALEENDLLVEDDAGDEADEEPEEMTAAQKRAARRKARKSKDDSDEEEDEKPAKGKKKPAKDEEEEEDEKPAKGKKSKKLPQLTADEIQGMDEDELGEVIEKYSLDTDLDDFKTLRKKAAAVIDAMEDGGHIEEE